MRPNVHTSHPAGGRLAAFSASIIYLTASCSNALQEISLGVQSACAVCLPSSISSLLDEIQKVEAMIRFKTRHLLEVTFDQYNIGGLCVMYQVNVVQTLLLPSLRLPSHNTLVVDTTRTRTEFHLSRYGRLVGPQAQGNQPPSRTSPHRL